VPAWRGQGKINAMLTISLLQALSHFIDRYVSILYSIDLYGIHPKDLFSLRRLKGMDGKTGRHDVIDSSGLKSLG
jgi:hypothetical protein